MSPLWLALLMVPSVADTVIRAVLAVASRRPPRERKVRKASELRTLVLVPSRGEGRHVEPCLRSLLLARGDLDCRVVVVLDGADPQAEAVCRELGVDAVVKEPAGPSKGAVLTWACERLGELISGVDAVIQVDVGSRVTPGFLAALDWPEGASGVQAWLHGVVDGGAGAAIALSERAAQSWEDRGREAVGWSVMLRGTGTALTPAALTWVAPRLVTRIEDKESSLLLASTGHRLVMAAPGAVVLDEKPAGIADAAQQRARWLLGRPVVLVRHALAVLRLVGRKPLEGLAFAVDLLSRPLVLTALLRLGVSAALLALGWHTPLWSAAAWCAAIGLASVVGDAVLLRLAGHLSWRATLRLVMAWVMAVALLPGALNRWRGVRRR